MRKVLVMLLSGLFAGGAYASYIEVRPLDTSVMACLEKRAEPISYPDRDEQLKVGGQIRVSLRFTASDQPPSVDVLFRAASDAMLNEVRAYLKSYRLPCLKPESGPVLVIQEFGFTPRATDAITWSSPRRVADAVAKPAGEAASSLACLRTPTDRPSIEDSGLQRDTRRQRAVSNVVVEALFDAPDQAPRLKVLYSTVSKPQERNVLAHIEQYRLPCLAKGAQPVGLQQQFNFMVGGKPRVLKDSAPLTTFLSNIKDIQSARVKFDFDSMACPFQVAWTLGRPAVANRVGEIGPPNLNRTEFLAWLGELQMNLDAEQFEYLLGQRMIINVPCGTLNLNGES